MLPEDLQALPYIPVIVSATPWFVILAVLALILSVISRRWIAMLMALACIGLQVWWQWPFFSASTKLPAAVDAAMASTRADTGDMIARVMTFNVYKGHADAKAIVDIVRDQRVEVLALQETTNDFIKKLDEAGIHSYLPYSQVSSSDGVYGNGIWSATELGRPVDDEVGSSASFMPGGTVTFGGGKAQLELEDENDILSCGIEIKVQPPGKQLKTITLLSGGEKAFVAIALYFAILKVHPTPFCVMDEIEAALDEANVVRYARYMRRIAGKTQFIVITHRRGTMEEADVLYGVTMQEKGVSRILTINLNDMAKELKIK